LNRTPIIPVTDAVTGAKDIRVTLNGQQFAVPFVVQDLVDWYRPYLDMPVVEYMTNLTLGFIRKEWSEDFKRNLTSILL